MSRHSLLSLVLLAGIGVAPFAAADTFCVGSTAELAAALQQAQDNGTDDAVHLRTGAYAITVLDVDVTDGHALQLEGGYASCAANPVPLPEDTVLDGMAAAGSFVRIRMSHGGALDVRGLSFTRLKPPAGTHAVTLGVNSYGDLLTLSNLDIGANAVAGIDDSVLQLNAVGGLVLRDSIAHDNANAAATVKISAQYPDNAVMVVNNTITANAGPGLVFAAYALTPSALYNNILWNNGTADLVLANIASSTPPLAMNNIWLNCSGCNGLSTASANNLTSNPNLTTTAPKYRPGASSQAINTGIPVPLVLGDVDAANAPRVQGSAPDRGAYETPTDDLAINTWLVTSTSDDPANLFGLRHAINAANASGRPSRIRFHFSSCPQLLPIGSPLPPIQVPLLVDGYWDPGSHPNTQPPLPDGAIPFDADLCAILIGSGSPLPETAFSIAPNAGPDVHVEVRGLRIMNFRTAIALNAGNGHWIHGNAFVGGLLGTVGNGFALNMTSGAASTIGGPGIADVNLVGGSYAGPAIRIAGLAGNPSVTSHATVVNNSIGADPSGVGSTVFANAQGGVDVVDTVSATVARNWIVANGGDGITLDNSSYTRVQSNAIGSDIVAGFGNAGAGVRVTNGGQRTWIGGMRPGANAGANTIIGNGGAGVWIDPAASAYNQVVENAIWNNGGLAIDLGAPGPTPNAGDENSGPNGLMHKPELSGATNVGGAMRLSGHVATSPNTIRYISVYASTRCGGDARRPLGLLIAQADANGSIDFALDVPPPPYGNAWITATAGTYTAGIVATSEISNSVPYHGADVLFTDGFDIDGPCE
ncbi:MAG: choice-of-anchor Q domain-containing protein [Dokdonella sp.]|uniref:choice-of-anchor Q domain-containing protein n=1 Tax=Dokdonella sp. TaxID=2291710 RepID=UPI003F7FCDBE